LISDPLNIILLDTDVFSYLMEPGDPRGRPYLRHVEGRITALSFITVGELLFGAFWRGWEACSADHRLCGPRLFDTAIEYGPVAIAAREKTRTAKSMTAHAGRSRPHLS
jgi:predicted nucleic acid-binding protein